MTVKQVRRGVALLALGMAAFTLVALVVEGEWTCCPRGETSVGLAPPVVAVALLVAEIVAGVTAWRGLAAIAGASWASAIGLSWVLAPRYSLVHIIAFGAVVVVIVLREQFFSGDA